MNRPVKILLTIRQGKIGGGESHVLDLIKHLDKSKFEPVVLSFTEGPMVDTLQRWGIKTHVIYTEKAFNFLVWKKVKHFLESEKIELVHAHGTRANSNIFWAARKLKLPLIYTAHGWSFHQDQPFFIRKLREAGEKFLTHKSDLTICVSDSNSRDGKERINLDRSVIITSGIDLEKFNPNATYSDLRAQFGIDKNDTLVGYLVRMTIQKDPHTLIEAIAHIAAKTSKIKFLIVGDGDLKESTVALAKKLNVEKYITFQSFRQDIPDVLANIDIYCLPSLWEGLPIGLLEAMAMKKAIVATPVDGTKEAIKNLDSGLLVPHRSPIELANAILQLHEHKELIHQYGENARKIIEERFEVKRMAREVEEVYADFLTQKPIPKSHA